MKLKLYLSFTHKITINVTYWEIVVSVVAYQYTVLELNTGASDQNDDLHLLNSQFMLERLN